MAEVSRDVAALVLFLSREQIGPDDHEKCRALCANVEDWDAVITLATRKFVAPMLYSHLSAIKPENLPDEALKKLKQEAMQASIWSLKVAAAQDRFFQKCILPSGCGHVFVKGVALAQRYYKNPGMRFCRDIDVLVPEDAMETVIRTAMANGYKVKIRDDLLTTTPSEEAITTLLKYDQIVLLLSPESVWLEVHTMLDYGLELFQSEQLLAQAVPLTGAEHGPRGMRTTEQFCFVCYHSTRHTWSRLHWLTDAEAMMRHESFDLGEVMAFAHQVGLEPTVLATLEFIETIKSVSWIEDGAKLSDHTKEVLSHCLANLNDDYQTEFRLRAKFGYLGLPYSWMLSKSHRLRAYWKRSKMGFAPSYYLYEKFPLPLYLQWLYYPIKPVFALFKRFAAPKL